jgi:O-succinylbenzoic acid--CoA ligase
VAAPVLDPGHSRFWESRESVVLYNPRDATTTSAAAALRSALDLAPVTAVTAVTAVANVANGGETEEGLIYFFTSGSSGHPTCAGFTRAALTLSARAVNAFLGVTADDTWLRVLPRFHVGGFGVEARAWAAGARLVTMDDRWDPRDFYRLCADQAVTRVSLVPTQVFDLVHAALTCPPSMRTVLVGGGSLRPSLQAAATALGWPVRASYGLTEAASTVAIQAADEPDGSRLTLLSHWTAQTDTQGRLVLHGPALPTRLGTISSLTDQPLWHPVSALHTSDRAHLDERTLTFLGRADRIVKRLGELIDLSLLDDQLADAALATGLTGRVRLRCEEDLRDQHRLVLECLQQAEGDAVAGHFNTTQPAFARITAVRVVGDLQLSPLGKPLPAAPLSRPVAGLHDASTEL